jgi:hypothetical protein
MTPWPAHKFTRLNDFISLAPPLRNLFDQCARRRPRRDARETLNFLLGSGEGKRRQGGGRIWTWGLGLDDDLAIIGRTSVMVNKILLILIIKNQ